MTVHTGSTYHHLFSRCYENQLNACSHGASIRHADRQPFAFKKHCI